MNIAFSCCDWFTELQLSALIPSHLVWKCIKTTIPIALVRYEIGCSLFRASQAPCWLSTISYPARSWNNCQITGAQTEVNELVAEQLLAITHECLAYFKYYYFVAQLVNAGQSCKRNVRNTASSRKSSDKVRVKMNVRDRKMRTIT